MNKLFILTLLLFLAGCQTVAITGDAGVVKDENGREGLNTVFGDQIVASRVPSMAAQFQYPISSEDVSLAALVTTGTVDYAESLLQLHTGTSTTGSVAVESTNYVRYIPGHEIQVFFTPVFSSNQNILQKAGLFDGSDGFYLQWDGTTLEACRIRMSVEYCEETNLTNFFGEGADLDPTKGNVFSITFGYLGFAPITFGVMNPQGGWEVLHKIEYPNSATETHITQTFLPMRGETTNTGNNNDTILSLGSFWAGIVDGNVEAGTKTDPTARFFTAESDVVSSSSGVLFAFKSKDQFGGIDNRVSSLLELVTCSTEGNKPVHFKLLKQPEYLSATWTNISENSILQVSNNLVLNVSAEDGESFLSWNMGKSDSFFESVAEQNLLLPPNGVAVFYFESPNTNDVQCSIRWAELF